MVKQIELCKLFVNGNYVGILQPFNQIWSIEIFFFAELVYVKQKVKLLRWSELDR